ncbi:hypothetical protein [Phaeocystidibacter luteus]|uniref:Cytochrome B n=1 Tax=Phaeocystidibacter luteus TaxID=911197 RepID=A0A6N6RJS9_9FLAO|nr:hypothetical protein [Phaeocystidibacter luteus]KAB2814043.1 hypothetical protein F8C67_05010 [Phaeocystidibacter luteus]
MYQGLLHTHWLLAVLVLIVLLLTVVNMVMGVAGKREFGKGSQKLSLFSLIFSHLQLVVGLVLYFVSPFGFKAFEAGNVMSDSFTRFYAVEHIAVNIIAIILITIGRSGLKRKDTDAAKYRHGMIFFGLGFLLLLSRVPWDRLFELPGA